MFYLTQAIGIMGAIFSFIAFQCRKHLTLSILKVCSVTCFVIQFLLLKAYVGLALNFYGVIIIVVDAILVRKNKKTLPFVIISLVVCLALGVFTWDGPISIAALLGELIITVAYGVKDTNKVRYIYFFGSIGWLIYDSVYFTLGGIMTETFSIVSIIIATIRMLVEKRRNQNIPVESQEAEDEQETPEAGVTASEEGNN